MMTTTIMLDHIVAYATQVRFCLRDLGPEQVEDLTDGLEADLAEAIEDPDGRPITGEIPIAKQASRDGAAGRESLSDGTTVIDLTRRFGEPETYAAELRSAAGLPPARVVPEEQLGFGGRLGQRVIRIYGQLRSLDVTEHPQWPAAWKAIREVRPLWSALLIWVLTNLGLGLFVGIDAVPAVLIGCVLVVFLTVLSILYGLGIWIPKRGIRHASRLLNVLAVLLLWPVLATTQSPPPSTEYVYIDSGETYVHTSDEFGSGAALYVGGQRATNLFVYGPDGEFIDGARILDQDGRPVKLTPDGSLWDPNQDVSMFWEPRGDVSGGEVWNAYPLGFWTSRMANWDNETDQWVLPEGVNVRPQVPPVASLNAMAAPDAAASSDDEAGADTEPEPDPEVPEEDAP